MDIRIGSFRYQATAGMMNALLESRGLHPRPLDTSAHISVASADLWYYIYVSKDEAEEAKRILAEFGNEKNLIK